MGPAPGVREVRANVRQRERRYTVCCTYRSIIDHSLFYFVAAELMDFKKRRVAAFKKNLVELCELELKHANVSQNSFFNSDELSICNALDNWLSLR